MGGERASSTRQREAGRVCCICGLALGAPPWGSYGERRCARCEAARPRHRVRMDFRLIPNGWAVSFFCPAGNATLGRRLTFADSAKIHELARRGHMTALGDPRFSLDYTLASGGGSAWLLLTDEQYNRLR